MQMQDKIQFEPDFALGAKIKVVGVGGGGTNAVDAMVEAGLRNVDFYVVNTDAQALARSKVPTKIQIGSDITHGRGAGADPDVGARAAMDSKEEISEALRGADMVFITAGLGGGTGTGAAPVVAEIAKSMNILTVAVVTRPFKFEGPQRMNKANEGLDRLRQYVDTCLIVTNDRLLEVVGQKATLKEAFSVANAVLKIGVQSISDLINEPGLINVDFADVRTIMNETGGAVMGVGSGKGENRATEAVKKACSSPLLDKIVIDGARGVLICVTGGPDMTLFEIDEATSMVYESAAPDANIIFGAVIDERMKDEIRVTIIATGFEDRLLRTDRPILEREDARPGMSSLKDKLGSMLGSEKKPAAAAPKTEPALASRKTDAPEKGSDGDKRAEEQPADAKREPEVLDFDHPGNPLRGSALSFSDKDRHAATETPAPAGDEKGKDDDFETPAFLLRRKNLFE